MDQTDNLQLPYIMPQQAQKHVPHNEAIRMLDAIVQLGVVSDAYLEPPIGPITGSRFIIAANATSEWSGRDNQIAAYQDGAWTYFTPLPGWSAWVESKNTQLIWNGSEWLPLPGSENSDIFGVNTQGDDTNRLAVKSDAVLLSHDDVTPGTGNIQTVLNKADNTKTATILFQDNYSGRAEIGLAGNDDFSFKTSTDGTNFNNTIVVKAADNHVGIGTDLPQAPLHVQGEDAGICLENSLDPGSLWTIATGRSGNYEDHLIFCHGEDIQTPANHRIRLPKTGSPEFVEGIRVTDDKSVGSNSSAALAFWKPFDGDKSIMSFRGAANSAKAEYSMSAFYHDGTFNSVSVAKWVADSSGPRLGIGVVAPSCTLDVGGAARVGSFTIATKPSASTTGAGAVIYISDEANGPTLAFSDGVSWRRIRDNVVVS